MAIDVLLAVGIMMQLFLSFLLKLG